MSASREEVSHGVTRVELRAPLESVLGQFDVSALTPDRSREQVGEGANQATASSGFAFFVVVEHGRFLPALGVRALKARLYRIESPPLASELTRTFSITDRYVPLRVDLYEESGTTVLLTVRSATRFRKMRWPRSPLAIWPRRF